MDFKSVPKNFRPVPFWSWNEKLNAEETVRQIEEMDKQGIGGFFMHARGGLQTEYMGKEWFENIEASIKKCEENGMKAWAYDENGWPSGFGDGIVNGMGIEYQQKYLRVEKGEKNTDRTITNTDGYHFYYDVNPFYVDTLSHDVIKEFIENIYQPYYDKFGNRFEGFFTDEPQISRDGIPWSFTLPKQYEKRYGENLLEVLPHLFFDEGNYKKTRVKFWKMITELFSENYAKQIYDWCENHGLKLTGHLVCEETLNCQITSNGACMPHYEYFHIPGMDWLGRHNTKSLTPYQVGSAARQLGKKQVLSETFAMCGHNVGQDELKWIYEHQMVRGINLICQHLEGYSNRGLRKRDYPPAMYIQQPWWKESHVFNDAVSRIGMILSGGDDEVETLLIHPQTSAWANFSGLDRAHASKRHGEEALEKLNDDFLALTVQLERKHINFHLGDEILMERHGKVEGKYLVIGEKKYSTVILPRHDFFFENTERLLAEFKANGGKVTAVENLPENDIIDVPDITYCKRRYDDFDFYYFVNSTENTYDAFIKKGAKVMNPVTGELSDFDGHHVFRKYESLIVIDDGSARPEKMPQKELYPLDLGGTWTVKNCSENVLTLDYCDYYFDGELIEKNGYVLNATYRAIDLLRPVKIRCEYRFNAEYIPEKLYLGTETPEIFDIKLNGKPIDKTDCGYFADKAFRKLDITNLTEKGENVLTLETDFRQSEKVYENVKKSYLFESEKNKLTFDREIEQIYLIGDFSVKTDGKFAKLEKNAERYEGGFTITAPKKEICLKNIEQQGYPFFAGEITVQKAFDLDRKDYMLDFEKTGINAVKVKINGKELPVFMWEPFRADISELVSCGKNEIELTLINNLRNMQGPLHLEEGESYAVGPSCFYKEKCLWLNNVPADRWNDNYCFANISLGNRKA